ncbi:hypothetical protein GQ53DRAFT_836781 [Thozetella sp. PMI_491]|nr:hypothetical protein GQ53DRAFT_836781 [Thozetella sp. PMI_491]
MQLSQLFFQLLAVVAVAGAVAIPHAASAEAKFDKRYCGEDELKKRYCGEDELKKRYCGEDELKKRYCGEDELK